MPRPVSRRAAIAAGASLALLRPAAALPPPGSSIALVVGATPGGTNDTLAREMAPVMSERLGRTVVVENRAGAGGNLAAQHVARARPDGGTLLVAFTSHTLNTILQRSLPYRPLEDFTPITLLAQLPVSVLVVRPNLPEQTLAAFVAAARAAPDRFSFALGGLGSSVHMQTVMARVALGLTGPEVTFRGTAPAIADVAAGTVDAMFAPISVAMPLIEGGRVRPIAITGSAPSPRFPGLPTLESAVPGVRSVGAWFGLFGPAGMAEETVVALHAAAAEALRQPRLRERFLADGGDVGGISPSEFRAFIERDLALWREVARLGNIQPE
ncbi:MAG: tripartite tricarboxylate transporter substrate-binding protein [Acetobacteraceae bacterium]|nr:tripartite tricarboxylate transporter substrate-binding protein [Acetobacteraceae bacterium]MCX7683733.1 tripartite tricarboxylate transporter substrate-binding protein [Acetobacteraceae bacterium]MDW8399456.1 tripartite tricarboxylate transporter substrate-binding protein [Acetobacteraceae bacterium]